MQAHAGLLRVVGTAARISMVLFLCGLLLTPVALQFMSHKDVDRPDAMTSTAAGTRLRFTLKGNVKGLWPGGRKSLQLRIENRNAFAIRVLSLSLAAQSSNKPGCEAGWIRAPKTKRFRLSVEPLSARVASYPVTLAKNAPNACQGARWPLRFTGTARRAR